MKGYLIIGVMFWSLGLCAQKNNRQVLEKLLDRNQYYEVLRYVDSLDRVGVKTPDLLFYKGKANEGVLRYKEAYRCYSDWLNQDSTNRDACIALARVATLAGRTMKAFDLYEKLVQEDSLDFFVNYQLARLYQQNNKFGQAVQVYERLCEADTTNSALLKRVGDCYARMGWAMNAVDNYKYAFRLDPEDGEVVVKAVNIMLAVKEALFANYIDDSMELVDSALVYSPRLNTLKQLRGVLLYLKRRYPDSEDVFRDLIVQGDSTRMNFKYLGLSLFHMNRSKEALEPLYLADSMFRDDLGNRLDFDLSMRYGENLGRCEETQKALKVFKEIEEQMMPDTLTLFRLAFFSGKVCEQVDDREQAIKNYWRAYKLRDKNRNLIYTLLNFQYGLWTEEGRREKATEQEVRKALFFHVLFLQKVKDTFSGGRNSLHTLSKDILQKELDEMFFRHENNMVVVDPDGKKYTYSADEIRQLIKSEIKPTAL